MQTLATAIRELRNPSICSQATFAKQLGVTPVIVSRWETGKVTPSPVSARKLIEHGLDPTVLADAVNNRSKGAA